MKKSITYITLRLLLLLLLTSLLCIQQISSAADIINSTQILRDGYNLVSSGGRFELGFFSPGDSKNRYLGIWYKKIPTTVVWVANREIPLTSRSGVLKVVKPGILILLNDTNNAIWYSNTSRVAQTPVVQLLDSGNLVLREANDDRPQNFLWQSFDYLCDTFLPNMDFGWNDASDIQNYLSSWKTEEDPAPGDFTFYLDSTGYPQFILKRGAVTAYRTGPWNGIFFSGAPHAKYPSFTYEVFMNRNRATYREDTIDSSVISRITLSQSGIVQRWTWVDPNRGWILHSNIPGDICDTYKYCGAYGSCNTGNSPACGCLSGFVPKDPNGWSSTDWSNGCIRRMPLNCQKGDVFLKYSRIKLPDAPYSWFHENMTLEECKVVCLKNCSCVAYTQLDISEGSGCFFWHGEDLIDIKDITTEGQDVYIRMASSELDLKRKRRNIVMSILISFMGMALLGLGLMLYYWKRKRSNAKTRRGGRRIESHNEDFDLPLFDLSTITKATNNFSISNKLGQGGYGPVYKGMLENRQDIAVKRLSKTSAQGLDEFKNEVICIAKLQHRNLVKLLGCCIEGEEKMLIYEYMPNKSLDLILFDQMKNLSLNWPMRVQIVNGVARGLMYIHQDSQLRIIHRDLKASNILLDTDMNPKISDFGIARGFRGNETEDKTSQVVGTYGYMSPEYAVHGRFSLKSDVFSFGVLVLEIVSGKRNSGFSGGDQCLNLLGHAWTLYKEGRSLELVDPLVCDSDNTSQVLKLIHVGLLCVQQRPEDRPNMNSVVAMLGNEVALSQAKQPGFFTERDVNVAESSTSGSSNEITITQLQAR